MDVEVLAEDDWKILRDVRLRALDDSPTAFLSTYQAEESRDDAEWRARTSAGVWVVVHIDREIIGVANSIRVDDRPADERHLESIWVDPRHRNQGVLRAILRCLSMLEPDVQSWMLWVLDGNDGARAAYERIGFEATGERQSLPGGSNRIEERLRLDSRAAAGTPENCGSVP